MASYQGSPFEAGIGPTDGDIVLFAACPPPEELGFEPATGHWRKQLPIGDVQAVWQSRPVGTFRGERCIVLDDLGDRLHIGYLGQDVYKAEQLGYWQVDRGVYELVAPRTEVSEILEERTEFPRRPAQPELSGYAAPAGQPDPSAHLSAAARPDPASFQPWAAQSGGYPLQPATSPGAAWQADQHSGSYPVMAGRPQPDMTASGPMTSPAYLPAPDDTTGVTLPAPPEAPLPVEAEAMRAASASRRPRQPAAQRRGVAAGAMPAEPSPVPGPATQAEPAAQASPATVPGPVTQPGPVLVPDHAAAPSRQRRAARRRMATERLFADLAGQAGIPADSYAVGEEVEGALCLVQTEHGFEVFHSADGARHELQVFATEESACFYLFGVLAAEAVRTGVLARMPAGPAALRA